LKSAGRRTAPGLRFARVATLDEVGDGIHAGGLANSMRLYMIAATVLRADSDPK
jgi:hypothetical protein